MKIKVKCPYCGWKLEETIKIIIPGKPIFKKRPRFARRGKFVTVYSDQETDEGKALWEIRQQRPEKLIDNHISVALWFGMPIPKSTSKKRSLLMSQGKIHHTKKPDIDNLIKFYLDVMNGEIYEDDKQIIDLYAAKGYSSSPSTWIVIADRDIGENIKDEKHDTTIPQYRQPGV